MNVLILTQAIKLEPWNTRIAMDMVQIFLDTGEIDAARTLFARLPEKDQRSEMGKSLRGPLWFHELAEKTPGIDVLTQCLKENQDDFGARFDSSVCLVAQHLYQEALEELFYILQRDSEYKQAATRDAMTSLLKTLRSNEPSLADEYRRKLSNIFTG
jgi:putative thioredoxin